MLIIEPRSKEEFDQYFYLRWELLRKPWNQVKGSEKDEMEKDCIHAMMYEVPHLPIGVSRLQFNSPLEAQIRYMAVKDDYRGKGIGTLLIDYLEKKAIEQKTIQRIVLQARSNAVIFYEKNGYRIKEKSFLLWGTIQHYLMEKVLF